MNQGNRMTIGLTYDLRSEYLARGYSEEETAELDRDGLSLTAEIRSVNHRFCEVSLRSPKVVSLFEDRIRQLIADRFSRGKFNLTITWSGAGETGEELKVNECGVEFRECIEATLQALMRNLYHEPDRKDADGPPSATPDKAALR